MLVNGSSYFLVTVGLLLVVSVCVVSSDGKPVDVQVTLRGKKYIVPSVSTVRELQDSIQEQSGLSTSKQGVLFSGRKLKSSDVLEDVGIVGGSVVNIVPSTATTKKKSSTPSKKTPVKKDMSDDAVATTATEKESTSMEQMLKQAGVDPNQINSLFNRMSNDSNDDGEGMPSMEESMKMMQQMMNSPLFEQYINDPEKLEQSRQMILSNPMMKHMMEGMPGFDEILNDPIQWRETMIAAAGMYKNMGADFMNALGATNNAGGTMPDDGMGYFDSFDTSIAAAAALDELSEEED